VRPVACPVLAHRIKEMRGVGEKIARMLTQLEAARGMYVR